MAFGESDPETVASLNVLFRKGVRAFTVDELPALQIPQLNPMQLLEVLNSLDLVRVQAC
jgi:hypothetical protein